MERRVVGRARRFLAKWAGGMTRGRLRMARAVGDRRGVTAAEYAVLCVGVIIVVGVGVGQLADPTTGAFARVGGSISQAITDLKTLR